MNRYDRVFYQKLAGYQSNFFVFQYSFNWGDILNLFCKNYMPYGITDKFRKNRFLSEL